jgi:hypothetical protein
MYGIFKFVSNMTKISAFYMESKCVYDISQNFSRKSFGYELQDKIKIHI